MNSGTTEIQLSALEVLPTQPSTPQHLCDYLCGDSLLELSGTYIEETVRTVSNFAWFPGSWPFA